MTDKELLSAIRTIVKEEIKEGKKVYLNENKVILHHPLPDMSKYLNKEMKQS